MFFLLCMLLVIWRTASKHICIHKYVRKESQTKHSKSCIAVIGALTIVCRPLPPLVLLTGSGPVSHSSKINYIYTSDFQIVECTCCGEARSPFRMGGWPVEKCRVKLWRKMIYKGKTEFA